MRSIVSNPIREKVKMDIFPPPYLQKSLGVSNPIREKVKMVKTSLKKDLIIFVSNPIREKVKIDFASS